MNKSLPPDEYCNIPKSAQFLSVTTTNDPINCSAEPLVKPKQAYENNKLCKRLSRLMGQAIDDFKMITANDRVMVCVSGGKDSYALLDILLLLQSRAEINFEIIAVNLDQGQPGFPKHILPEYFKQRNIRFHIEARDTFSIVKKIIPEGKTTCSLCSRLRRGNLYRIANELGATKIALGHHRNDILETFFLNMFYGGCLKGMPAKLKSDDGKHIVIRPLAYVEEQDLIKYAELRQFPIIPCNLCGSQPNLKRVEMKKMLLDWKQKFPGRVESIFNSLSHIAPSHLMDRQHFPFQNLLADCPSLKAEDIINNNFDSITDLNHAYADDMQANEFNEPNYKPIYFQEKS